MKKRMENSLKAFAIIVVFGFGFGAFAQADLIAQQNCLSDVQIQQGVSGGSILPLNIVMNNAGLDRSAKVLPPVSVCAIDGQLFYQFSILNKNGVAQKLVLPATASLT